MVAYATLDNAGVGIVHHFSSGLYAKETQIPAGVLLTQHVHSFDHLSALMKGTCTVTVDGRTTYHEAPEFLTIRAGQAHEVYAMTDVVWACLHATDETDPERIDHVILGN